MAGRFVRSSSYRHVFGAPNKTEGCFLGIRPECKGEGGFIACSPDFWACPVVGGGGPMIVKKHDDFGRLGAGVKKVAVHKGAVVDLDFNPFISSMLGSASEDCTAKITSIPSGGVVDSDITDSLVTLSGHQKKVVMIKFNPAAANVCATISGDQTLKLWDVQAQTDVQTINVNEQPYWVDWNDNGSLACVTSKEKVFSIFDPRAGAYGTTTPGFQGGKSARVIFCDESNMMFGCGFGRSSGRQLAAWDPKNLSKPLFTKDLDQSASIMNPYWCGDNKVLFLVGKGDASIKYFEFLNEAPYLHFLDEFRDTKSQKGGGWVPKRSLDVNKCEIARCMRLMPDMVVPVSFQVPRKSDLFQADIFPDAYAGVPALDAKSYFAGQNGTPARVSMKPGAQQISSSGGATAAFVVKKSRAELEAENAQLKAQVAKLEAQLKSLQS